MSYGSMSIPISRPRSHSAISRQRRSPSIVIPAKAHSCPGFGWVSQNARQTASRFAARNRVAKHHSWERSAVPYMRSSFSRLLEPLDRRVVARLVAEHRGDHGVGKGEHAWTCERHLKTLLFAQWAGLRSLREMVAGLSSQSVSLYHLNLRPPCRSTLSDANAQRPAAVFGAIAAAPVPVAAGAARGGSEAVIRLLDSTPIPPH